jgi:pyruvate dehydrogenase E1 component
MSSWIAAATSYANHELQMMPFFIFYSMFGFQRIGDLAWAAGDMQARGFLIGGTAGRTTLAGEGLQHQDGHSHISAATIPNCVSYDPTFAYELAIIIHHGMTRMYRDKENVFFYITVMNENYPHPPMPKNVEEGIVRGMYLLHSQPKPQVQLLGSGTILREVIAASTILKTDFGITSNVWSVTSFSELRKDAQECARWNRLHPENTPKKSFLEVLLDGQEGPCVAATDYIRAYPEQIREFIKTNYSVLGTDGFGRSDTREQLREYFEVNSHYIAITALKALADEGEIEMKTVTEAIQKYNIDPEKPNPIRQ